ncbi:helix-turn-helix domain-containing protein [Carboxydocella sp. ULO1]|uniref:helix-turn-helix domain-containing protein n=1 Tax=Carboxydocella sp. ULO1 TaxID=1926599 RepID=UPI0009AD291F|nr:helix-turn-helix transcriptional regulator [Carboxydocella sp. ULO1]GAW28958.1 helix-turn-helix domain protein [Carboxydocella sp. ULO1]
MDISERIVHLRTLRNISQYKLAKISGISQAGLSDIELGKKQPTVQTLDKILKALNVSWAEFFSEETPDMPPDLRQLLQEAESLTPEQRQLLTAFLKSLKGD